MSRREGRESDSKRHRSKFDREPSPKRSRRDGKQATERPSSNLNLDVGGPLDRDQKNRRRLQDALPLESPQAPDSKVGTGAGRKEFDKRTTEQREGGRNSSNPTEVPRRKEFDKRTSKQREGSKNSSNPTEAPRSRSYFQHDKHGNAGQAGRTTGRGAASERGWKDSKDQRSERGVEKPSTRDTEQRDEKSQARGGDNRVWRLDGFYEIQADQQPSARKRPSFREQKVVVDSENAEKAGAEPVKPSHPDNPLVGRERRAERGGHNPRYPERPEKPVAGDKESNRGESQRGSFPSRERFGGGNNYRGRERFNGRQGYPPSGGVRVEKWKHDLFEEADKSPTAKNEEDQIAKVEALLAS